MSSMRSARGFSQRRQSQEVQSSLKSILLGKDGGWFHGLSDEVARESWHGGAWCDAAGGGTERRDRQAGKAARIFILPHVHPHVAGARKGKGVCTRTVQYSVMVPYRRVGLSGVVLSCAR